MIRFSEFEKLGVAVAAFSDQSDGNCSLRIPAALESSRETRAKLAAACGMDPKDIVCVQQVHGVDVVRAGAAERGRGATVWEEALGPADSIVTDVPGLPVAVLVADCVPLYLFDPVKRVGGVVHAGWRGTFDDAAGRAVAALEREWGSQPSDILALTGPSAGPCCYQVTEELAEDFLDAGLAVNGRNLDLWESNIRMLVQAGVPREQVMVSGLCTLCDHRFYSHRRDPSGGRNMALLVL